MFFSLWMELVDQSSTTRVFVFVFLILFCFGGKGFNTQETQHYICVCICDLSVNTVLQERTEKDGVFHICGQDKSCH